MNVLITSAGRRVSLVRAFQKELKKINPKAKVFASDANPELAAACHVAEDFFKVPPLSDPSYIPDLIEKCRQNDIRLIIPTIDTELALLAKNEKILVENNIEPVISSVEFIRKCRDKRVIHDFFESKGITVAKEYSKENYVLPMFIKPFDGSRSLDTFLIRSKDDLTDYHFENEKLMFLQYIDHNEFDEYTCDLYYGKDGILKCVVPRKRIVVRDGEINTGLTERNELVTYIKKHLHSIEGARGCLTAQLFKHKSKNEIYGIEINPRFGGGYPLSYLAGANYPKWILQEYLLNTSIKEDFDCWEDNLLMIRYDDEILVHGFKG